MARHNDGYDEMAALLSAMADSGLSDSQRRRLGELVARDPELREIYFAFVEVDTMLAWEHGRISPHLGVFCDASVASRGSFDAPAVPSAASPASSLPSTTMHGVVGYFSSGWPVAYLVSTVILAIGLLIGSFTHVSPPMPIAVQSSRPTGLAVVASKDKFVGRITGMVDCQWVQSPALDPRLSTLVSLGNTFALGSGLMEITYDTGARVILQGPCTYEVESRTGGFLSLGRLTARLEKKVESGESRVESTEQQAANPQSLIPNPLLSTTHYPLFTIKTPTATVTDLGTEFGVEVDKKGVTQVHVLQGLVEARRIGDSEGLERLGKGEAVEIGRKGEPIKTVTFAPQSFTRTLQQTVNDSAEAAYINAVLDDKPIGYWPLNEPAGTRRFRDLSGNGIPGYAMGKPVAGQSGPLSEHSRAVMLDGHSYIDLGRHDEFAMTNDFTVEAWVWIGDATRSNYVFSALGKTGDSYHGWGLVAGHNRASTGDTANAPLDLYFIIQGVEYFHFPLRKDESIVGRWLHVAVAFDRDNTAQLYLNGEHRGSVAHGTPSVVGPAWLEIGCAEPIDDDLWRGCLAHVAVYPRALDAENIQNHYRQRSLGGDNGEKRE